MALIVHKYGGSSVKSIERIEAVADHIAERALAGDQLVVTISAMGAQTDELTQMAMQISPYPPRRELDMLLTAGERISMALLSIALQKRGHHAVSLTGSQSGILTDEMHGNARIHKILGDRIRQGITAGRVVIVAGFQGVSPKTREVTTLGRGGSDLSAVALAAALDAKEVHLYKDVDGVYSADPRMVANARLLAKINHSTLAEMAWLGASVLHPRSLHVAKKYGVRLSIRSSYKLDHVGTIVVEDEAMESATVVAMTQKTDMVLLKINCKPTQIGLVVSAGLQSLWELGESPVAMMQTSDAMESMWQLVVSKANLTAFEKDMASRCSEQAPHMKIATVCDDLACLSIVGSGFQQSPEIMSIIAEVVPGPVMLTYRDSAISICVPKSSAAATLEKLHQRLAPV